MKAPHPTRGLLLTLTVLLSAITAFLLAGGTALAEPSDTTPENAAAMAAEKAAQETVTAPEEDETEENETETDETNANEIEAGETEADNGETDDAEVTDTETDDTETDDAEADETDEDEAETADFEADSEETDSETKPSYRMVTLDELDSILKLPENANAATLLAFIESTDTLRPAGLMEQNTDAETQLRQLDLFLTKVLDARIAAAEKVLTLQDVDEETRQDAIDYKIASLLSLAKVDEKNEPRMRAYLDELRKDAEPTFAWNLDSVQLHYDFGKLQKAPSVEDYRAMIARLLDHIRKGCEQKCLDTDFLEAVLPFVMIAEKLLPTKDAVETLNGLATLLEKEEDETCKLVVDYFRMTAKRLSLVGQPLAKTFQTFDGKEAKIDAKPGKNTVLVFWAVEDQNSLEEIPFLLQMYQGYHAKGFDVISIVCDDDSEELRELLKQVDFDWPTVLDGSNTDEKKQPALWSNEFSVTGLPTKLLIGPDGKVASSNIELVDLLDVLERAYGKIDETAPKAKKKDPQLEAAEAEINAAIDAAVEQPVESPVKPAVEPTEDPAKTPAEEPSSKRPVRNGPSEETPVEPAAGQTAEAPAETPTESAVESPANNDAPAVESQGENALNASEKTPGETPGKNAEAAPKKNVGKAKTHKTKTSKPKDEPTVQPGEVLIVPNWGEEPVEDDSDDADEVDTDEDDGDDELKDDEDDDSNDDDSDDDADDDDSDDMDDDADEDDEDDDPDDDADEDDATERPDVKDSAKADTTPNPAEGEAQAPPENTDMAETPRTEDEERLISEDEDNMEDNDELFSIEENNDDDFDDGQPKG